MKHVSYHFKLLFDIHLTFFLDIKGWFKKLEPTREELESFSLMGLNNLLLNDSHFLTLKIPNATEQRFC